MKSIQVALLGFGTVGQGVYETITTHQEVLKEILGAPVRVSAIVVETLLKHKNFPEQSLLTTSFKDVIKDPDIDIVIEAIVGVEPAATYLKQAIDAKKHIITANKEMFARHGVTLKSLAQEKKTKVGYEATTGGGIPIIQTIEQLLKVNQIHQISAILNGTSNYILTVMRNQQVSFNEALVRAQKLGIAEADPTNDIDGWDTFYKLMILSELIYKQQPDWKTIKHSGIKNITSAYINELNGTNKRIKLIATLELFDGKLHAKVEPTILSESHPLFNIEGVDNAISIKTDLLSQLTLSGPGAGSLPTASAILEDLCTIFKVKYVTKKSSFVSQT